MIEWISIKERTPPMREGVLIISSRRTYISDVVHSWIMQDGNWARWNHDFEPTHWAAINLPRNHINVQYR